MKVNAYILAADPAWIEASVLSYYDLVNTIFVSYDETRTGWTGLPIAVDECLERLKAIDPDGKISYSPGRYANLSTSVHAMEKETYQRQCALNEASVDADWVIQLDTDEVLPDAKEFINCMQAADNQGFEGLHYPNRFFYCALGSGRYLEWGTRFWQLSAGYPGPAAVRAGTQLKFARQFAGSLFQVGYQQPTLKEAQSGKKVHRIIQPDQAVYHYSWVRSEQMMKYKSRISGHANDSDWTPELKRWMWSKRHPYLAMLTSPLQRGPDKKHLRIVNVGTKAILPSIGRSIHEE